jgi:hypothetical protein
MVEFISADTSILGLGDLAASIVQHRDLYADERVRQAAEQLEAMVECVPDMGIPRGVPKVLTAVVHSDTEALKGHGSYYLVPHRTVRGAQGIYVVRVRGPNLLFAGIAANEPDPLVEVRKASEPVRPAVPGAASQNVTADIANTVAGYF